VLTATELINATWQILPPHKIDIPQTITKNVTQAITLTTPAAVPNLAQIRLE